jgi:hypothetical protein
VATVFVAGAVLLVIVAEAARAAESDSFGVEPSPIVTEEGARRTFGFEIRAGESIRDRLRVFNTTDRPVAVRLYGAGVEFVGDHHEVAGYTGRAVGTGGWVETEEEEVVLPPRGDRVVEFSVSVPGGAHPGEHLAAVVAEPLAGERAGGLDLVPRLAILIRLEVEPGTGGSPAIPVVVALALSGGVAALLWRRRVPSLS